MLAMYSAIYYFCYIFLFTIEDCTEGSVELVGLSEDFAGIVRVCSGGEWGTVCADRFTPWSEKNSEVACRTAGFAGAVNPILQSTSVSPCLSLFDYL